MSQSLSRKNFLVLSISTTASAALAIACSDDASEPNTNTGGAGGSTPGGGGSSAGRGGSSNNAGSGGSGGSQAGSGGSASGGGGAGGSAGAGGSGGSGGAGGSAGSGGSGGAAGMCGTAMIQHTSTTTQHTHVVDDVQMDLEAHVNGATATMAFMVPGDGMGDHTHVFTLTAEQVNTLRGGGTVMGVTTAPDGTGHTHTYTISCAA